MKLLILLTFIVGGALCASLKEAADELLEILPVDRLKEVAENHFQNNGDVQKILAYLKTPEFQQLVAQIRSNPATRDLETFLQDEGVDTNEIVETAEQYVTNAEAGEDGSLKLTDAIGDVLNVLPVERIKGFVISHISDPWFLSLVGRVRRVMEGLSAVPELQPLLNQVKDSGLLKLLL